MTLPLSKSVLVEEMSLSMRILQKWTNLVNEGIPSIDLPTQNEAALDDFLREFSGELSLVSSKLENISLLLMGSGE